MPSPSHSPLVGKDGNGNPFDFDAIDDGSGNKQLVHRRAGTTGFDYSVNMPGVPVLGATTFGGSTAYAAWVLIQTIPAAPVRNNLTIANYTADQIMLVRDDGTAVTSGALVNASVSLLDPATTTAQDRVVWETFRGRVQIFGPAVPTGSNFISIFGD